MSISSIDQHLSKSAYPPHIHIVNGLCQKGRWLATAVPGKPAIVLCLCLIGISLPTPQTHAQTPPDILVFDESTPAAQGYYDSSVPSVTAPSLLTTFASPFGPKMPIVTNQAYTGSQSGLLEWRSVSGGDWIVFVASPGFQIHDATGYSNVVFFLNGPQAVPASALPKVGLESSNSQRTATVNLGTYLAAGLDSDTNTWQAVIIPLTAFQPYGSFSPAQFKDVFFAQAQADNVPHTVCLDNLRVTDSSLPGTPTQLVSRAGDRSVILHWSANPEPGVTGYRVYRGPSTNGPFNLLSSQLLSLPSYTDFAVTNGQDYFYLVRALNGASLESSNSSIVQASPRAFANDVAFLEYMQQTAFDFFWYEANPTNGLVRDRSRTNSFCSIAAVGFGLTGIGVAIDHGWITRDAGKQRVLTTLQTFWNGPQGTNTAGIIGYKGWFYHFLDTSTASRFGTTELSSIDTALLLSGVLYSRQYFSQSDPVENQIRSLADSIYNRVDWLWMCNGSNSLTMGWHPESGFITSRWIGYNEAMVLYIMAFGAPTNPLPGSQWSSWTSGYVWHTNYGEAYVEFPPLFGHQYSHCWIDFRHISDPYVSAHRISYFENSRRATLAQRAYCIANPFHFVGYSSNVWGLTACDGPGFGTYAGYNARGAPPAQNDDGTIAPTAPGGSLPFASEVCLPALRNMYDQFLTNIWCTYGFRDAFNLTANWWDTDVLGIDQGPILLMAENYRTQSVWRVFMSIPEIQRGLQAAGFTNLSYVPLQIQKSVPTGAMLLSWPAVSPQNYQVEYSPDLMEWLMSPAGFMTAIGSSLTWTDAGPPATDSFPATNDRRFYRVFQFGSP